ncbi:hypothetical protein R3P38DRAFT_2788163 [Favolaschia claudopus]|uniref:Uncharacterized protein n=1 Tax=Favolaschia claudopus TaxID=2862362 RepID=A0AAW0AM89_9AGAR
MSSSRPPKSLSASHTKKKKSKPTNQPESPPVSVPPLAGVPAATTVANKAASPQHSYSPGARTDSLSLRSSPSSRTPEPELQSDFSPRTFPIYIPHRWNENQFAPFRDGVPIEGSELQWLRPPSWTRSLLQAKQQKFILTDHLGVLVWMETSNVRSTFQTYDRDLSRILCFKGASSDIFAGVVEAETYGMPVPRFPFLSIQKDMVIPQTSSSWMYLEESGPEPQQPLAVPSAKTLGRSPRNPFQRLHHERDEGSNGDEDLHLRNPSQHELPTNVLAVFGKLDLKEIGNKLSTVASADVGRSLCPLAMVGDAQSLWLMYENTTDCLYAFGLLDRYVKGLEFLRFETHANFAERFNMGQQRWKLPKLDWSPHNPPPVEELIHSRAPDNVSGEDTPIPGAEGSLLQNLSPTTVPPSLVSTPAPEAHESIPTDGILEQSQSHNESGPTPVAPPLENSIPVAVCLPRIPSPSPAVDEAIPTEDAPDSPLSSISSALSDVESDSEHEGHKSITVKRKLGPEEINSNPSTAKRVKLVLPQPPQQVPSISNALKLWMLLDTHELLCTNGEAWDAVYHAAFQFGNEKNIKFALKQILRDKQTGTCSIHGRYGFLNTEGHIEEYTSCPENVAVDSFREECLELAGFLWEEKEPGLSASSNIRRPWGEYYWVGHSNDPGVGVHPAPLKKRGLVDSALLAVRICPHERSAARLSPLRVTHPAQTIRERDCIQALLHATQYSAGSNFFDNSQNLPLSPDEHHDDDDRGPHQDVRMTPPEASQEGGDDDFDSGAAKDYDMRTPSANIHSDQSHHPRDENNTPDTHPT